MREPKEARSPLHLRGSFTFKELSVAVAHVKDNINSKLMISVGEGENAATKIQEVIRKLEDIEEKSPLSELRTWIHDVLEYIRTVNEINSEITKLMYAHDCSEQLLQRIEKSKEKIIKDYNNLKEVNDKNILEKKQLCLDLEQARQTIQDLTKVNDGGEPDGTEEPEKTGTFAYPK